jgi:hypothetical protein
LNGRSWSSVVPIVIGVDALKRTRTCVAVDAMGRKLGERNGLRCERGKRHRVEMGADELRLRADLQPVELAPASPRCRRGTTRSEAGALKVAVEVAADEDAVVLRENDGVLSWQMPTAHADSPNPKVDSAVKH